MSRLYTPLRSSVPAEAMEGQGSCSQACGQLLQHKAGSGGLSSHGEGLAAQEKVRKDESCSHCDPACLSKPPAKSSLPCYEEKLCADTRSLQSYSTEERIHFSSKGNHMFAESHTTMASALYHTQNAGCCLCHTSTHPRLPAEGSAGEDEAGSSGNPEMLERLQGALCCCS